MPIDADEWEAGAATGDDWDEVNDPLGTEKRLIVAFLGEDIGKAYRKTEILKGVEFAADDAPGTRRGPVGAIGDAVLDAVSHVAAAGIVLGDLDQALTELVEAGVVERREIATDDGTETYYRMAGASS
ncbi:hypothetical protein ACFPYI_09175 [Halomarina salina]|uniref:Uncharacterized protein n=1 Tax=Halomarina salina TaxID=1872699 RepID=A0ABD5RMU8_9EURY|nr:hypothetical protein [Halomarina salina]